MKRVLILIMLALLTTSAWAGVKKTDYPMHKYNVRWKGAQGDGVTNDQAAIQAAIDQAYAAGGGWVYVPEGVYLHDSVIVVKDSVYLFGPGEIRSTDVTTPNPAHAIKVTGDRSGLRGITVSTTWAGARQSNNNGCAVLVDGATNFTIEDVKIYGSATAGILVDSGTGGRIADCYVKNTLADGIHLTDVTTSVAVAGNKTDSTGDDCIAVVSYVANGAKCANIDITGNIVKNGSTRGITVVGGDNVTISDNIITNMVYAGLYIASEVSVSSYGATNITGSNNIIDSSGASSPSVYASIQIYGRDGYPTKNVKFEGGAAINCRYIGVTVGNTSELIDSTTANVKIANMTVKGGAGNTGFGLYAAGGTDITFQNNSIEHFGSYGLTAVASAGAGDIRIVGNTFRDIDTIETGTEDVIFLGKSTYNTAYIFLNGVYDLNDSTERFVELDTDSIGTVYYFSNQTGGLPSLPSSLGYLSDSLSSADLYTALDDETGSGAGALAMFSKGPAFNLLRGSNPTPTTNGDIQFDTTSGEKRIVIGDGTGQLRYMDSASAKVIYDVAYGGAGGDSTWAQIVITNGNADTIWIDTSGVHGNSANAVLEIDTIRFILAGDTAKIYRKADTLMFKECDTCTAQAFGSGSGSGVDDTTRVAPPLVRTVVNSALDSLGIDTTLMAAAVELEIDSLPNVTVIGDTTWTAGASVKLFAAPEIRLLDVSASPDTTVSYRMKDSMAAVLGNAWVPSIDSANHRIVWQAQTGGSGESTTASNKGTTADSVFYQLTGSDLEFRRLKDSTGVVITPSGDTALSFSFDPAYKVPLATIADSALAIEDGGVDLADLGQNGAAQGQIIKWDTVGADAWKIKDDDTATKPNAAVTADSALAMEDGGIDLADIGQNGAAQGQIMKWDTVGADGWKIANDSVGTGGGDSTSKVLYNPGTITDSLKILGDTLTLDTDNDTAWVASPDVLVVEADKIGSGTAVLEISSDSVKALQDLRFASGFDIYGVDTMTVATIDVGTKLDASGATVAFDAQSLDGADIKNNEITSTQLADDITVDSLDARVIALDTLETESDGVRYVDLDGGGLTTSAGVLAVGAGTGITVNANDIATTLGTDIATAEIQNHAVDTSKLNVTNNPQVTDAFLANATGGAMKFQPMATVAGAGLTAVAGPILAVGVDTTLTAAADVVRVTKIPDGAVSGTGKIAADAVDPPDLLASGATGQVPGYSSATAWTWLTPLQAGGTVALTGNWAAGANTYDISAVEALRAETVVTSTQGLYVGSQTVADSQAATKYYVRKRVDTLLWQAVILDPSSLGTNDTIPIAHTDSYMFPSGASIFRVGMWAAQGGACSDTIVFSYSTGADYTGVSVIDTLKCNASTTLEDSSPINGSPTSDDYVWVHFKNTPTFDGALHLFIAYAVTR